MRSCRLIHDFSTAVVFVVGLVATTVSAQNDDPVTNFCRRFSHEAAVLGDRLYIDGGQLNFAQNPRNFTNTRLLWHDLTTTVYNGDDRGMPVLKTNLSKPADVPSLIGGSLWADQANGRLFQFGGQWPDGSVPDDPFKMSTYDVYANSWSTLDVHDQVSRLSFGAGTSVEYLGKSFYLGGWMNGQSDRNWQGPRKASNKLVEYDMVHDQWKNNTGPDDRMGRAEGVLFYVPYSDNGFLVHFGGVQINDQAGVGEAPRPMNFIDLYDIANSKWYVQNATGDIPENRRRFCGGVAVAQDTSSANIYIYGGQGFGVNATGFDDVYVLSIPTFTWIKLYPAKGIVRKDSDAYPHYDLSCSVVKNSQLLIIGGQFPKDLGVTNCDAPDVWGVHNLAMSKVVVEGEKTYWNAFDPNITRYSVPEDIIAVIGGNGDGNAQIKSPDPKFDIAELNTLFRRTVVMEVRKPTRTAPTGPAPTTHTSSPQPGGVFSTPVKRVTILVPLLVGLFLVGVLAFFGIRWYRRSKVVPEPPLPDMMQKPQDPPPFSGMSVSEPTASMYPESSAGGYAPSEVMSEYPGSYMQRPAAELSAHPYIPSHNSLAGYYPPPLMEGIVEVQNPPPPFTDAQLKDQGWVYDK